MGLLPFNFLHPAAQGPLGQAKLDSVAGPHLVAAAQNAALLRPGHGIAPAQHLQRAQGVQLGHGPGKPPGLPVPVGPGRRCHLVLHIIQLEPPVLDKGQGVRQHPLFRQGLQPPLLPLQAVQHALGHAVLRPPQIPQQLRHIRHSDLRGVAGGGRPPVGHIVGDGHVRLVAHGGDHRDLRGIDGSGHPLVVEGPQVLHGAAAPAGDQHVPQLPAVGVPDGPHDLRRGLRPLDPHRQQQHPGDGIAPPQNADHVVDRRPGAAGNDGDPLGIRRQGPFMGGVKQSLLLELLLQLLKGHIQVPHPVRGQLGAV